MTALAFELPAPLEASSPPESRGLRRDQVRLLVASRRADTIVHTTFEALTEFLRPDDLLVLNVSATLPAAITAHRADGTATRVHVATRAPGLDDGWRVVELRTPDGAKPARGRAGERLSLAGEDTALELVAPYATSSRLLLALCNGREPFDDHLARFGEPIRYGYAAGRWPLSDYQTVYATTPGSAEMPSAGRPFSPELLVRLIGAGIRIAPLTLHTGVSSSERHEPPFPEFFDVPVATARAVNETRRAGGRVIAVGTTVVRALETVADGDGTVESGSGWTNTIITPERGASAIDGLITGWHEPAASHLQMLEAIAGERLLSRSYEAALERNYLWHEFGDSHLILP